MKKLTTFLSEVGSELRKIIWPSRDELVGSVVVVCVIVLFFAIVLGGMDSGFSTLVKRIIAG